jgi:heme O synthase-like polyprenyltransferase
MGGAFFIWRSIELVRDPGPKKAMANFFASFVQLGFLLFGAIIDAAIPL